MVFRHVKPRIFPIADKQLLSGRTVLPTHLARFFQPECSTLGPVHAGAAIDLDKLGLQGLQVVVVAVDGRRDWLHVGCTRSSCRECKEHEKQGKENNFWGAHPEIFHLPFSLDTDIECESEGELNLHFTVLRERRSATVAPINA